MGKVCNSSCPYYGVDANYDGYCKKDHNSYRDRGSACNMESSSSTSSSSSSTSSGTSRKPRTCNSSCPYYGIDANSDGYCKKDYNSYRDRGSTCNIGETVPVSSSSSSSSSSYSSSSSTGCFVVIVIILLLLIVLNLIPRIIIKLQSKDAPVSETYSSSTDTGDIAYTTVALNLRSGPSTSYGIIVTMPKNTKVVVDEIEGNWAHVIYGDVSGWCSTRYLDMQDETS